MEIIARKNIYFYNFNIVSFSVSQHVPCNKSDRMELKQIITNEFVGVKSFKISKVSESQERQESQDSKAELKKKLMRSSSIREGFN